MSCAQNRIPYEEGVPIPHQDQMIPKGDERITPYLTDTLFRGDPDWVYRARDTQDLSEILRSCSGNRIPVTVCGGRTGLAGGAMPAGGLLVAMEGKNRLLDISADPSSPQATAEAGILLGDFQRQIADTGFSYPPDPTSRFEAQLGGTVATNATGEDSLLYGPTRRYIRRLKFLKADGSGQTIERKIPYRGPTKNFGGYCLTGDPIDLLIGSEGTLGIITEVTVDLLPRPPDFFLCWAFFPDLDSALEFVTWGLSTNGIRPRSLELLDRVALTIVSRQQDAPVGARGENCAITFKQEFLGEPERDNLLGRWLTLIESVLKKRNSDPLVDQIVVATDDVSKEKLRKLRHSVPATVNEEARLFQKDGGGKIATDWWVPPQRIREMMREVRKESDELGLRWLAFAHIGDGHPHVNYIARNREEMKRAEDLLKRQCQRAVQFGGGVAGEHGLGKMYRDLLKIQWSEPQIRKMVEIKRKFDPFCLLGRGNILFPRSTLEPTAGEYSKGVRGKRSGEKTGRNQVARRRSR